LSHLGWYDAMLEEIKALDDNHTQELVDLPPSKKAVGCKWVFTVKVNPDGSIETQGQTYGHSICADLWCGLF
jgi:hypothetical protein